MKMNEEQLSGYEMWLKNIGKVISSHRQKLGLSQRQASEACSLNLKFYRDIEYGRRPVTTRTMFAICTGLNMPLPFGEAIRLICD